MKEFSPVFSRYTSFSPNVPVYCISQKNKPTIHRFYDTSPISPSGRYLTITELPYEDRVPSYGDSAAVSVIDLEEGVEIYHSRTKAWDTQVGAHAQWGRNDDELFFNRMDTGQWRAYGVKVNPFSGNEFRLSEAVYMVSHDGRYAIAPNFRKLSLVQRGYGITIPNPEQYLHKGAPEEDGIFITDTGSGESRLLVSLSEIGQVIIRRGINLRFEDGGLYGFHVKYNPQDTRIMYVVRWVPLSGKKRGIKSFLITLKADGSDINLALCAEQWLWGHHPNWTPDGDHIIMNLPQKHGDSRALKYKRILEKIIRRLGFHCHFPDTGKFISKFRFDGMYMSIVAPDHTGSGHPSFHPDGRFLVTDSYNYELPAFKDGTIPIRLIDIAKNNEKQIVRIRTIPKYNGPEGIFRVDPHPAWDRTGSYVVFNACPEGIRKVFIADLTNFIKVS